MAAILPGGGGVNLVNGSWIYIISCKVGDKNGFNLSNNEQCA